MSKEKKIILILLLALFFLPAAATLIHLKIHEVPWLPYLTLFDAFFVTTFFYFRRTAIFALFLNSIFVLIGTGYHLRFLPGGWSDIMISLTDLLLGVAVYILVTRDKAENRI